MKKPRSDSTTTDECNSSDAADTPAAYDSKPTAAEKEIEATVPSRSSNPAPKYDDARLRFRKGASAIESFLFELNDWPDGIDSDTRQKTRATHIQKAFRSLMDGLSGIRATNHMEVVAAVLAEYYFRLHANSSEQQSCANHLRVKSAKHDEEDDSDKRSSSDGRVPEADSSELFFLSTFIPILRGISDLAVESAKARKPRRKGDVEAVDKPDNDVQVDTNVVALGLPAAEAATAAGNGNALDTDGRMGSGDEPSDLPHITINVKSLYDLFSMTIVRIAKELTDSEVSILFLAPDQVFLEAALMLKSSDKPSGKDIRIPDDLPNYREGDYHAWAMRASELVYLAKSDQHKAGNLVNSEIPTYLLDWNKADGIDVTPGNGAPKVGASGAQGFNAGSSVAHDARPRAVKDRHESSPMGITASIAVNYKKPRGPNGDKQQVGHRGPPPYNFNAVEIQEHPAHLGKWDAVLWQGQRNNCKAILAVPISTDKLFIGILKVENPKDVTDDGHYKHKAVLEIQSLGAAVGKFFEEYDENKQVLNHIWTAHVLSRISQRTTQLLELLERGEPLRNNFTRVIGYILTSLKLIYGASEGIHVLTDRNVLTESAEDGRFPKKAPNCHVLDSFYPEYEQRIRGELNRDGCSKCEICQSFIHSKVVEQHESNELQLATMLAKELSPSTSMVSEVSSDISIMHIQALESWKARLSASTFGDEVRDVNFEFIPLLTQPKLLDSIASLEGYNRLHSGPKRGFPLCPIAKENTEKLSERCAEPVKLIVDHEKCGATPCPLCRDRRFRNIEESKKGKLVDDPDPYSRRALGFRLVANPYDFGLVVLFFKEANERVQVEKIDIVAQSKDDVTTAILNSVRILGKFLDSEYGDVKRFYIPRHRRPRVDKDVGILFADIRGFSRITKIIRMKNEFDLLESMVNDYYESMGDIVGIYGRVHQFLGDGIMAIFDEHEDDDPNGRCRTVVKSICCALAMQKSFKRLARRWLMDMRDAQINEDITPSLGIGINFGKVRFNYFGGPLQRAYSPIGDHVNFAQRLERLAARPAEIENISRLDGSSDNEARGYVMVSKTAYDHVTEYLRDEVRNSELLSMVNVKGFSFDYPVYRPLKSDLDLAKITKELGIDTKPLSDD